MTDNPKNLDDAWNASRLRLRIAERGVRIGWLREKMDVAHGTMTNWTHGRTEPRATDMVRLADLLECRIVDLLVPEEGGTDAE